MSEILLRAPLLRDRLIVGLDLSDRSRAEAMVTQLGSLVSFYKIGYQLALAGGLQFIADLRRLGKHVFLDMKLLDIDNTITKAVENVLKLDVNMLTIHAYPQAMRAAAQVAKGSDLTLLAVTVLTSMDDADLREAGYQSTAEQLVIRRAAQAMEAGFGGLVASAQEAQKLRALIGDDKALVTPGIRLEHFPKSRNRFLDKKCGEKQTVETQISDSIKSHCALSTPDDDQKRVMTPAKALHAGASHLVVARPIIQAQDPCAAAKTILANMESADQA